MLTTALSMPSGGDQEYIARSWQHALTRGRWTVMRGLPVLLLGNADYARMGGRIYSINGDSGTPAMPFGVRWEVGPYSNGHLDALAVEQFAKEGK